MKDGTILNLVALAMRAGYTLMIEGLPKQSWHDRRSMDYVKSSDWELGTVIKRHKWIEGTEIRYQSSDIGVGMGSNSCLQYIILDDLVTCAVR